MPNGSERVLVPRDPPSEAGDADHHERDLRVCAHIVSQILTTGRLMGAMEDGTHRDGELCRVVDLDGVLVAPDGVEELVHDVHGLVPHESVVSLSGRGARPRGTGHGVRVRFAVDGGQCEYA